MELATPMPWAYKYENNGKDLGPIGVGLIQNESVSILNETKVNIFQIQI